jgi:DNA polymerase-1
MGESRIHTALNLNTETGRLSSMRPNLQNQPALEKDVYAVRRAFSAQKGNKLIVVDYGQLELRVMAHMTKCQSMIDAFALGGDFHSRTAIDMYPHVKAAVDRQEVIFESRAARMRTCLDTQLRDLAPLNSAPMAVSVVL